MIVVGHGHKIDRVLPCNSASGGAYAAIAALTSIPATLLAAFTYETMLMDSDRGNAFQDSDITGMRKLS